MTVEPGWLTEVLRISGVTGAAVVGVESRPVEVASAAGDLARLALTYEPSGRPGPPTIIAKAPGTTETQRAMEAAMGLFTRERFVYAELAGVLPIGLPHCYFAGSPDGGEPMLLEDLRGLR
ncbi:MAG: hypothetical protein ACRDH5_16765, partial [bacterium]